MARFGVRTILASAIVWVTLCQFNWSSEGPWFPSRVLITNDNGIDDPKIVALARAFSARSEVWVVAPAEDRSGSGNYLTITRVGELAVQSRDLGEGIQAFAVEGFPADCVIVALTGIMRDHPPDLVVSGINGGANLGVDWMFSGTVGAARVAALAGVRSIAVSGLDDDLPGAVNAATSWVVDLAASPAIRDQQRGEYLTVSMPRVLPSEIRGVRVADRAPPHKKPELEKTKDGSGWKIVGMEEIEGPVPPSSDRAAFQEGFIAVVPMRADEVDRSRLIRWFRNRPSLPAWNPAAVEKR